MITRLLVGILTPAMRAIHPSPFRQRSTCEIKRRRNPLDVRWRPALVENRERTQKVPCARKWRRDPERLRDSGDVERNFRMSSEIWRSRPLLYRGFPGVTLPEAPPVHRNGAQIASIRPNGQAPCRKPYTEPSPQAPAKAKLNQGLRSSKV